VPEYRHGHKSWIPSSCPRQPPEYQVRMGIAAMAQVAQAVLRRPGLRPSKSHPKRATHCGSTQSMVTADTMFATYATLRSHPDVTRRPSRMPRRSRQERAFCEPAVSHEYSFGRLRALSLIRGPVESDHPRTYPSLSQVRIRVSPL